MNKVVLNGNDLTLDDLINIVRNDYQVELCKDAVEKVKETRKYVEKLVDDEKVVYGLTTGFGKFSDVFISKDDASQLQTNLIISHSCGVGAMLEDQYAKGIMVLRVNALVKGFSGVRLSTIEKLVEMINANVIPQVPEQGSLGASGDLAPLSHVALVMLGYGSAKYNGEVLPGKEAMKKANIDTITLTSKEGLALINGTQAMTSIGAITLYDTINLLKTADIASGLTFEALRGITDALRPQLHQVRPHAGQINTAANLRAILEGSKRTTKQGELRVQDAYSLRCTPQVHGGSKDAIKYVLDKVNIEMNSVTDNPVIFAEDDIAISGGNFHGQVMAIAFDTLSIAIAEIANIAERRIERLVNPALSGLPAFLCENGGLNSGFMILQYSAASLVSENKPLAHPASVDSIPSSANQEDHVSMGTIGARKARDILKNAQKVVAMELLTAAQALDIQKETLHLGKGTKIAYDLIREKCEYVANDVEMHTLINNAIDVVVSNDILSTYEQKYDKLDV